MYKFHNNLKQVKLKKITEFTFFFPLFYLSENTIANSKTEKAKVGRMNIKDMVSVSRSAQKH